MRLYFYVIMNEEYWDEQRVALDEAHLLQFMVEYCKFGTRHKSLMTVIFENSTICFVCI